MRNFCLIATFVAGLLFAAGCRKSVPQSGSSGGGVASGTATPSGDIASIQEGAGKDVTAPLLSSFMINRGEPTTDTQTVTLQIEFKEDGPPVGLKLILAEISDSTQTCAARYGLGKLSEAEWSKSQDVAYRLSSFPGTKRLCAWMTDSSGNIDVAAGKSAEITLDVKSPPIVSLLQVTSPSSSPVVSFTIQDQEGFDLTGDAISISFTVDNLNWTSLATVKTSELSCVQTELTTCTGEFRGLPSSSAFFSVRAVARDRSGNLSTPVISDIQNVARWSVYAGTNDRGLGSSGTGAVLYHGGSAPISAFSVHPKTGDIYAIDVDGAGGLLKLSAQTGRVTQVIPHGGFNLPKSGILNSTLRINSGQSSVRFDRNGFMYLYGSDLGSVYQIDLDKNTFRIYAGEPNPALQKIDKPSTLSIVWGGFIFDEENSMYVKSSCDGTASGSTFSFRIMKITQNKKDFTADQVIHIAGNCVRGKPVSGSQASKSPISAGNYAFGTMGVFNSGEHQTIYFQNYGDTMTYKVVDGKIFKAPGMPYNVNNMLSNQNGALYGSGTRCTPSFEQADGKEVCATIMGTSVSDKINCTADGIPASQACINDSLGYSAGISGPIYFGDGPQVNSPRPYRIRTIDAAGIVRTVFGSTPMRADGIHRSALKANFAGIYYKSEAEPNQQAFPAGLYFMDYLAMVFGRIDPVTGKVEVIWGNQSGAASKTNAPGTKATVALKMGLSYGGGDGMPLAFDAQGLPWMRVGSAIVSLGKDREIIYRSGTWNPKTLSLAVSPKTSTGAAWKLSTRWQMAPDLSPTPGDFTMSVDGGLKNFALSGPGELYLLGGYFDPNNTPEFAQAKLPVIKLFDFAKGVVRSVMGDPAASGIVQSQELPKTCFYNAPSGGGHCFAYFGQKDQQLYFSDGQSIKYITKPSIPAESALGTLLTLPADLAPKRTIYNFTLMWDEAVGAYTRAYTIENTGKLYCYPLADAGKSSLCNGLPLGPNWPRASIARMSNQLTWKDADTLMISTPSGNVFEVEVN